MNIQDTQSLNKSFRNGHDEGAKLRVQLLTICNTFKVKTVSEIETDAESYLSNKK